MTAQVDRVADAEYARYTQKISWADVAARMKATPRDGRRRDARHVRGAASTAETLERCTSRPTPATAERAVVPRIGAINDGNDEADTAVASASNTGVASATRDFGWNSCRFIATRCRWGPRAPIPQELRNSGIRMWIVRASR